MEYTVPRHSIMADLLIMKNMKKFAPSLTSPFKNLELLSLALVKISNG